MANRFLSSVCILAMAACTMAGVTPYANSPYARYHLPAAAATVYQSQPLAYHAVSPYFARSLVAAAPAPAAATLESYASPILRTYAASPLTAVSPILTAAAAAAPVYARSAVVAAPAAAVAKSAVVAPATAVLKTLEDFDSEPRYDFSYGVHDSLTGDIKNQVESRNGGNVAGSYSLLDADGYKRTVTYTADDLNGFNAVVHREPAVAVAAPVAVATPVQHHFEYLPAQHGIQQGYLPAAPTQPDAASEPIPVEYPAQQNPSYPHFANPQEDDNGIYALDDEDTEIVEARSATKNAASASGASPAPITESQKDVKPPKRTA